MLTPEQHDRLAEQHYNSFKVRWATCQEDFAGKTFEQAYAEDKALFDEYVARGGVAWQPIPGVSQAEVDELVITPKHRVKAWSRSFYFFGRTWNFWISMRKEGK